MDGTVTVGIVAPVLAAPCAVGKDHTGIALGITDSRYGEGHANAIREIHGTAVNTTCLIAACARAVPLVVDVGTEVTVTLDIACHEFGIVERQFRTPVVHHAGVQFDIDILCADSVGESDEVDGKDGHTRACTMQRHGIGAIALHHHRAFAVVVIAPVLTAPGAIGKDHRGLALRTANTRDGKGDGD